MFTGIVTGVGTVTAIELRETCHRLTIKTDLDLSDGKLGESISINGCCLTVVKLGDASFEVDVAAESLKVTTLSGLQEGDAVNLERAMRMSDRLGGHWVQGHVDGIATLKSREPYPEGELWSLQYPAALRRYLVKKGSITVDGVSLTLNEVDSEKFEIFLIPHTLEVTTFGQMQAGQPLNLEVDILGKYIESLMTHSSTS